jgi:hypothetical protein
LPSCPRTTSPAVADFTCSSTWSGIIYVATRRLRLWPDQAAAEQHGLGAAMTSGRGVTR